MEDKSLEEIREENDRMIARIKRQLTEIDEEITEINYNLKTLN